jgi:hypothetical protein
MRLRRVGLERVIDDGRVAAGLGSDSQQAERPQASKINSRCHHLQSLNDSEWHPLLLLIPSRPARFIEIALAFISLPIHQNTASAVSKIRHFI